MTDRLSGRFLYFLLALAVIVLDRATKALVRSHIPLYDSISVIPGFFRLTHLENPGAAFGILASSPAVWKTGLLIAFSVVALVIVSGLLWKSSRAFSSTTVGLALILGGAIGNLWDRLLHGRVTDFLLFYYREYQWPAFNAADSAIVVGACLLILDLVLPSRGTQKA